MQNERFDQNRNDMDEQNRQMDEKQEITSMYEQPNPLIAGEEKKAEDKMRKKEEGKNSKSSGTGNPGK